MDERVGEQFDSRFLETGGKISELDVQSLSGVYQNLTQMPLYEEYTGRFYRSEKGGKRYKFWIRPTIQWTWSEECEGSLSRSVVTDKIKTVMQEWDSIQTKMNKQNSSIKGWTLAIIPLTVTFVFSAIAFGCSGACKSYCKIFGEFVSWGCLYILQVLFILDFLANTQSSLATLDRVSNNINFHNTVNKCVDKYTVIPTEELRDSYEVERAKREGIVSLCWVMFALSTVNLLVATGIFFFRRRTHQRQQDR